MGVISTVYIDGNSFTSATGIWTDALLTTYAAAGWYSDGSMARYWDGQVLAPPSSCPSCNIECSNISFTANSGTSTTIPNPPNPSSNVGRKFITNFDSKDGLGAIIIRFFPNDVPNGINISYDGTDYRIFSSFLEGELNGGTGGTATWVGKNNLADCFIDNIGGYNWEFSPFLFDGSSFNSLGGTSTETVTTGNIQGTDTEPGECITVISKTNAQVSNVEATVYALCNSDDWSLAMECPTTLPSFASSLKQNTKSDACNNVTYPDDVDQTYYFAGFTGQGSGVAKNNFVFSDANAATPLANGFYRVGQSVVIQVNANGIVQNILPCGAAPSNWKAYRCFDEAVVCVSGVPNNASGNSHIEVLEDSCIYRLDQELPGDCPSNSIGWRSFSDDPNTIECADTCALVKFINSSDQSVNVSYTDCSGVTQQLFCFGNSVNEVCLRSFDPSTLPSFISYELIDCDCDGFVKYLATLCGDSTVTVVLGAPANIPALPSGTLVRASDTSLGSDCTYVIEGTSTEPIDYYIISVVEDETCADQCITYKIENSTNLSYNFTFRDCSGIIRNGFIRAAETSSNPVAVTVCAKPYSLNLPFRESGLTSEVLLCNCFS